MLKEFTICYFCRKCPETCKLFHRTITTKAAQPLPWPKELTEHVTFFFQCTALFVDLANHPQQVFLHLKSEMYEVDNFHSILPFSKDQYLIVRCFHLREHFS